MHEVARLVGPPVRRWREVAAAVTVELAVVAFVAGAVVSLAMSWLLVSRLERVGERFGLSEALLGLLAALAADTPEITASVTAISHDQRTIGAGVVIGSNVFNLAALLGLGAVVAGRVGLHRKVVVLGGAVAMWVAIACLGSVAGVVSPLVGLILVLVVLVPYVVVLGGHGRVLSRARLPSRWSAWLASAIDEEEVELVGSVHPRRGRPKDAVVAVAALAVVVVASVEMERGASTLGRHYAVANVVVGGLVLAAVTSLPNAVAAVYLAAKGRGAAALSTALNSNTLNVLAGLLVPAALIGMAKPSGQGLLVAAWYLGLTALTLALAYVDHGLGRWAGWAIVACYGAFVASVLAIS
jgi:cation:H+ antiporter